MRTRRLILIAAFALLPVSAAFSAERGLVIRAGDLYAEPFIDAAKVGPVAPEQAVTIVERRGGWLRVEAGQRRGWVRLLNVRLEAVARPAGNTAAMRTGSRGGTVVTGVKGLDDADIRNASVDRVQQARLEALGASDGQARQQAAAGRLKETNVAYLKPGKVK